MLLSLVYFEYSQGPYMELMSGWHLRDVTIQEEKQVMCLYFDHLLRSDRWIGTTNITKDAADYSCFGNPAQCLPIWNMQNRLITAYPEPPAIFTGPPPVCLLDIFFMEPPDHFEFSVSFLN